MHRAVMHNVDYLPEGETEQWFASLDGEHWLPVNREPAEGDRADVEELFGSHQGSDGRTMQYLTFARRYLNHMGAEILQ